MNSNKPKLDNLIQFQSEQFEPINIPFTESIPDDLVNITNRVRTNLFPWRGQFSPQLIEALLRSYVKTNDVVYDPFCGSGTLLIEAALLDIQAIGRELNPAAYHLSKVYTLINFNRNEVDFCLRDIESFLHTISDNELQDDMFNDIGFQKAISKILERINQETVEISQIILQAYLTLLDLNRELKHSDFTNTWLRVKSTIQDLPKSARDINVSLGDSRYSQLDDDLVDVVITSPPYINVFNYHQNYRKSVESLGYDILKIAKTEIGSNRKFRSNRFYTVIQYTLDMYLVLKDLKRVCRPDARIIFIVGRESNVRGTPFHNAEIIKAVAKCLGFEYCGEQSRNFKNKFGRQIFEEILRFEIPIMK